METMLSLPQHAHGWFRTQILSLNPSKFGSGRSGFETSTYITVTFAPYAGMAIRSASMDPTQITASGPATKYKDRSCSGFWTLNFVKSKLQQTCV